MNERLIKKVNGTTTFYDLNKTGENQIDDAQLHSFSKRLYLYK